MSKRTFLKGAAILGIAGLTVQGMGAIFRIPLANIIGPEGMGYYQTVYPIYIFLLVFSTNGAPVAISKMVSERLALGKAGEAHRVFRLSFLFMAVFGIIAAAFFFFGAKWIIVTLMGANIKSHYAMMAIAPALLLIPIMSVYRGYFQGMQEMGPTAISQLVEQAIRVAAGLTLAFLFLSKGPEFAAAGATMGTSIGPIAGVLVLVFVYSIKRKKILSAVGQAMLSEKEKESNWSIIKTLATIAVPITIAVSITPIMNLADSFLVIRRLRDSGISETAANDLYGQLTGFPSPIINLPMALALSMALAMVPAIAAANSTKDIEFLNTNVRLGLRTAMIIGVPCSIGLAVLAEPILKLIYPMQEEVAMNTANCLAILAMGVIFLCIAQTMAGVLQGLSKMDTAVWSLAGGFLVKCILTYTLTFIPSLGIEGAAISTTMGYITVAIISFVCVQRFTKIRFDFSLSVVKPMISGIVMGILVVAVFRLGTPFIGEKLSTVFAICVGAASYGITLIKIKAIMESEIAILPKGPKLVSLLKKVKML